jgi:predicted transposase YbfD/YdcC
MLKLFSITISSVNNINMNASEIITHKGQFNNFIEALESLTDTRDNRGKRHTYVFVITSVVIATMKGKSTLSSIFRYIKINLALLRKITNKGVAKHISRAHLPRFLEKLDWIAVNEIIENHFGVRIKIDLKKEWVAIDGKVMRGTIKYGDQQAIVHAVTHNERIEVATARQIGKKSSEIPVVRRMINESGLEKGNLTLDALHCNPETTEQINKSKGTYLIQVKENQSGLLNHCKNIYQDGSAVDVNEDVEKEHGRLTTRVGSTFHIDITKIHSRWKPSGVKTLVVIERDSIEMSTQKESHETSYYICNKKIDASPQHTSTALISAVRNHWAVESNNWVLDVIFNEDNIKIKSGNQAQILCRLRTLSADLIRRSGVTKIKAAIENYADSNPTLLKMLKQVNFL